jgi:hypothetical protein
MASKKQQSPGPGCLVAVAIAVLLIIIGAIAHACSGSSTPASQSVGTGPNSAASSSSFAPFRPQRLPRRLRAIIVNGTITISCHRQRPLPRHQRPLPRRRLLATPSPMRGHATSRVNSAETPTTGRPAAQATAKRSFVKKTMAGGGNRCDRLVSSPSSSNANRLTHCSGGRLYLPGSAESQVNDWLDCA